MSPEAQRIAIAKVMGFAHTIKNDLSEWRSPDGEWLGGSVLPLISFPGIPDYPNDLNACFEMEKTLNPIQLHAMGDILCKILPHPDWMFKWSKSTAAQRCEAFLKTIGKWEEKACAGE